MATASGGSGFDPGDKGSRYRLLYNEKIQTSNPRDFPALKHKQPNKHEQHGIDRRTGFAVYEFAEFYIMKREDQGTDLSSVSPFYIEAAIKNQAGDGAMVKRLKDGTLLIRAKSEAQTKRLLAIKKLGNHEYNVSVKEHGSLNETQGIIYCRDSIFLTEQEIEDGLNAQNQKVSKVYKMKKMHNKVLVDSGLCIITFKSTNLPENIKFGFLQINVDTYIPNPMKCKNCFRFGHTKKKCNGNRVCVSCSESFHEPTTCSDIKCINCGGLHTNTSKECPIYKREHEIQKIKVLERISYIDAKRKYAGLYPTASHSSYSKPLITQPEIANTNNDTLIHSLSKQNSTYTTLKPHQPPKTVTSNTPKSTEHTLPTSPVAHQSDSNTYKNQNSNIINTQITNSNITENTNTQIKINTNITNKQNTNTQITSTLKELSTETKNQSELLDDSEDPFLGFPSTNAMEI